MKKEIEITIRSLRDILDGTPWFGRSVYVLLDEVDQSKVFIKPNESSHSLIELLYHMNTWSDFVLKRIEKEQIKDMVAFEEMDWRKIDKATHDWNTGVAEFKSIHQNIIDLLETKDDEFLNEKVDYRKFDFRFLLNGLIQHDIYHLGQIAYLSKLV